MHTLAIAHTCDSFKYEYQVVYANFTGFNQRFIHLDPFVS